jgi:hypothetical protein
VLTASLRETFDTQQKKSFFPNLISAATLKVMASCHTLLQEDKFATKRFAE